MEVIHENVLLCSIGGDFGIFEVIFFLKHVEDGKSLREITYDLLHARLYFLKANLGR
jgi:hypothetical protein